MNKLFNFTQIKGKWHKFPYFNLGGGAKLYKNFAQKLLAVSLCIAVVLLGTPVTTYIAEAAEPVASGTCGDESVNNGNDVEWKLETNGTVTVDGVEKNTYTLTISGSGAMRDFSVHAYGDDRPWKSVIDTLTYVQFNDGVTHVGDYSFQGASLLSSVSFPPSLSSVGPYSFQDTGLATVAFPDALKTIGNYAFLNTNLEFVVLPDAVTSVGTGAFSGMASRAVVFCPRDSLYEGDNSGLDATSSVVYEPVSNSSVALVNGHFRWGNAVAICPHVMGDKFTIVSSSLPMLPLSVPSGACVSNWDCPCGKTDCAPLGHDMAAATCTEAAKCKREGCTHTEGAPLDHDMAAATCTEAAKCKREGCTHTEGSALGHDMAAATCTEAAKCKRAGCTHTDGSALGHDMAAATCTERAKCQRAGCTHTEGAPLDHDMAAATCTERAKCQRAGCTHTEGEPLDHDMADATCTEPKKCKREGCTHTEGDPLDHDLSDAVISEPTAEKLGVVHCKCSRGDYDVFSRYTLGDGASPTMYPDGTRISDASYTPTAGGPFNLNGQEIEILLQDPLGVLGSGELGLTVRQTDLPATFDGDVPVEHQHSYEIVPTVDGVEVRGQLRDKVRLLYKIPQGWDRADLEVFLAQAGEDGEFDEVTEKIGDDEYLVVWTDHFSPYVFVDKLNPEEKAALETLQAADGSRGDSNTLQGDAGNGQTNGDHSIKTGDASGEILILSTLAMIATGLYLGLFLKKKKSF